MAHKLIVCESPAKARKISQLLKKADPNHAWEVVATQGHFMDLPYNKMGIDFANSFEPKWEPVKRKILWALKKAMKSADSILIGTDDDREGEGIAQHVYDLTTAYAATVSRIRFNEITSTALLEAISTPDKIDKELVAAQNARRVLDRIIGYSVSPILWRNLGPGLSSGRVQACVFDEIVTRERARRSHVAKQQWRLACQVQGATTQPCMIHSASFDTAAEAHVALAKVPQATLHFSANESVQQPYGCFNTSLLLQFMGARYRLAASQTMRCAQWLFEQGYITYHRTTSQATGIKFAKSALTYAQSLDPALCALTPRTFSNLQSGGHEAIRPTDITLSPTEAKLQGDYDKVYTAIWTRAVGTQGKEATIENQTVDLKTEAGEVLASGTGRRLVDPGWHKLTMFTFWQRTQEFDPKQLNLLHSGVEDHWTKPPSRYTQASLIRWMEDKDVGRPSTYASVLYSLYSHGALWPNTQMPLEPRPRGEAINVFLEHQFKDLLDPDFTAQMEEDLDAIAAGKKQYLTVMQEYWAWLQPLVLEAKKFWLKTAEKCPSCQADLEIWMDKKGSDPYLWCSSSCSWWAYACFSDTGEVTISPQGQTAPGPT